MKNQQSEEKRIHPLNMVIYAVALIVMVIGIIYLLRYFIHDMTYEETNDAQIEAFISPVSARTGGFIKEVRFGEHQKVKKGDTLVILDGRESAIKINEAEAALEDATAQLAVLESGIEAARVGTMVNQNQAIASKSRLWQQQKDIKRYENLLQEEAATGQEFDQVKSRFEVAASEYQASRNTVKTSIAKIEEMISRRKVLLANIKSKQAELEFAKINQLYTIVTAPDNGTMGRKSLVQGQQIQAGQTLASIVKEERWITANFKETQLQGMQPGQKVEILVDALEGKIFEGKIEAISASTGSKFSLLPADNSTGNFVKIVQRIPVKIAIMEKDMESFKAGMNVNVLVRKVR